MRLRHVAAAVLFVALLDGAEQSRARDDADRKHPDALPTSWGPSVPVTLGIERQIVMCSDYPSVDNDLVWVEDGFEYFGRSFSAAIRRDGTFEIRSRGSFSWLLRSNLGATDLPGGGQTINGLAAMGASSMFEFELERDCFMAQTQKLRQALERAYAR